MDSVHLSDYSCSNFRKNTSICMKLIMSRLLQYVFNLKLCVCSINSSLHGWKKIRTLPRCSSYLKYIFIIFTTSNKMKFSYIIQVYYRILSKEKSCLESVVLLQVPAKEQFRITVCRQMEMIYIIEVHIFHTENKAYNF